MKKVNFIPAGPNTNIHLMEVFKPNLRYFTLENFSLLLGLYLMHLTAPFHGCRTTKKKIQRQLHFQTLLCRVSTTEHG